MIDSAKNRLKCCLFFLREYYLPFRTFLLLVFSVPHSDLGGFAWKIPWTEEPGRLQSMGSLESTGHD